MNGRGGEEVGGDAVGEVIDLTLCGGLEGG